MNDRGVILVLNAGSSSLKFSVYPSPSADEWQLATRGQIEGIGTAPVFLARDAEDQTLDRHALKDVGDARDGLRVLSDWLPAHFPGARVLAVGHRVVHGGARYAAPTLVTAPVMGDLRALIPLAPLHQPHNLAAIDAIAERLPDVPQVACFDTGFHRGHAPVADVVPLPETIRRLGVQRYGFHGLSYEYIASALRRVAPDVAAGRVLVAHLGSGASMCAMHHGRSVDNSFGFTALDGLCMGTRPGALDPGVVLYLFQELKLSPADVEAILYKQSGLLGLSGLSNDMRALLASQEPGARLAVDYFVYRCAKEIGALAAVLGGIDALVFTAGIGERSAEIRDRICRASSWLGIDVDQDANARHGPRISTRESRVSAWVIPTNEELMIARHTWAALNQS